MAQENGLLGNSNFQIVSYPSGQEVIRAFLNHSIDIASLTGDETLRIAESGEQPRIFYVLDFSYGADALVARPPIRSIQELKGKRIAVEPKAIGAYFLVRALDTAGLVLDDVEIVPDLISEQIRTYLDGEVSALVTFEPTLERLKSLGAQTIFSSRDIPEEIFDVLITRPDFLKKHAEDLKKITQAWNLVTEELKRSPGSTIEKLARYYNLTESDVAKILDGIRIPSAEEQKRLLSPTDGSILGKLRKTAQIMYEHKLIRSPEVSAELLVTP